MLALLLLRIANFRTRPGTATFLWPTTGFGLGAIYAALDLGVARWVAIAVTIAFVAEEVIMVLRSRRNLASTLR